MEVSDAKRLKALEKNFRLKKRVAEQALEELREVRGLPEQILTDNGPEFTGRALDQWAHARAVKLQFIEPGRPMQNGHRESFNGTFRDECLNQSWFRDVEEARQGTEKHRRDYNQQRPHGALGNLTSEEFLRGPAGPAAPRGARGRELRERNSPSQPGNNARWTLKVFL